MHCPLDRALSSYTNVGSFLLPPRKSPSRTAAPAHDPNPKQGHRCPGANVWSRRYNYCLYLALEYCGDERVVPIDADAPRIYIYTQAESGD